MPIISEGKDARDIINRIISTGKSIPCFCTESVYTTEAIFKGAKLFKLHNNISGNLPIIIAFTANYADRQQLKNYTGLEDLREGLLAVKADIERLSRSTGHYHDLDIIVHLDHAQPGKDNWILEEYDDFISSVMWDCSHYSMAENIAMTKEFVKANKSNFVIEGAVDEITNYNPEGKDIKLIDDITQPEAAEKFFYETGCDLIVANLGTEHRRTEGKVKYHGDIAQIISSKIGRRLVLHGTSSINEEEMQNLPHDGIVKVNLWSNLESIPGKKLAEVLIRNLEHQLSIEQIKTLIEEGYLNTKMMDKIYKPSIHYLTEKYRRDQIYLPETIKIIEKTLMSLYGTGS